MYKLLVFFIMIVNTMADFVFNDTVFMPTVDRQVTKDMLEPQAGGGPKFLKDAFFLYQNLDAAADLIDAKDKRGVETYLDLMRDGGPHFIKRSYDDPLLRDIYKWGPDEIEELTAILGATEKAWNVLERKAIDSS